MVKELDIPIKTFADYKATKIEKGWSGDTKYLLEKGDEKLLLKIADASHYDQKLSEFKIFEQLERENIPSNIPIDFGFDDGDKYVWMVLAWIEGVDLREQLLAFSESEQYDFGIEAGKILQRIHQLEIPKPIDNWEVRFNKKIDNKLQMYDE